jgi:hypothetical protein
VTVFEPGAFDATAARAGVATTVQGRPGFYALLTDLFSGDETGQHRNVEPTIAWEYAPNAWALVHGAFGEPAAVSAPTDGTVPATLLRIAKGVVIGAATPVRLPFKLGYVPVGIHPVQAGVTSPDNPGAGIQFDSDEQPHDWRDPYRYLTSPFDVRMAAAMPSEWRPDTTLAGLPAMTNGPNQIILQRDGYWLTIGGGANAEPLSTDMVRRHRFAAQLAPFDLTSRARPPGR